MDKNLERLIALFPPGSMDLATWHAHRGQVRLYVERAMNDPDREAEYLGAARASLNMARQLEADAAPVREAAK